MSPLYPLFADLGGREVLVVGGGEVAARKVASLLRVGARVQLCARAIVHPELQQAVARGQVRHLPGEFDPAWLDQVWLVIAATDDAAFNAALAAEAGRRRRLANVVDDAVLSSFQVPAVVERSPLVVAISSAGAAPMLARRLRERLETLLDPGLGHVAGLFGQHRERIRRLLPDLALRRRWFEYMLDGRLDALASAPEALEQAFLAELDALESGADAAVAARGWVALVPASSEPDLYTLRALRVLNQADAILATPGLAAAALEPARRDAHYQVLEASVLPGRALELAGQGQRVVHLYGEDAGTAGTLARACAAAGLACRRIPGLA
mgnify:CR=1 FL=1